MKNIELEREQKIKIARIVASAVLTLAAVLALAAYFIPADGIAKLIIYAVPYLIVGYDVIIGAVKDLTKREIGEEFLMSAATIGAFCLAEYGEAVAVMLFYQIGELFGDIATDSSRRSIEALFDIRPDSATVIRGGKEITVPPEAVEAGEIIVVRPGERIPLDGEIIKGETTVDTSALTGESIPVSLTAGDKAVSGTVNLSGVCTIKTSGTYGESTVAGILRLAETSAEKKARTENFVARFAKIYTPAVVTAAILLALLPPIFSFGTFSEWVGRALVFLVISCPCALVVSVPLAFFGGLGGASRDGILIKGSNYMEVLADADTFVFDKTGTLTRGQFGVSEICPADGISAEALLKTTAYAESFSSHPIAVSIVTAFCGEYGGKIDKSKIENAAETAGRGVSAYIDGRLCLAGSAELLSSHGIMTPAGAADNMGGSVVHTALDGKYLGCIVAADEIKPDAASATSELKSLGIKKIVMLTGDSEAAALRVGGAVGADEIHARALPKDKVTIVEDLINEGHRVVFVGDGINDAPVLNRADVGVAMGGMGSDAAIQSADVVLMDDKMSKLPAAVMRSRKTVAIAKQNIVISIAVKLAVLFLGALGLANMWMATVADVGVLIAAVINALRTMKKAPQKKAPPQLFREPVNNR
ncbi:MAG: cadmium-translocating P-type ATPase [Firmicutes bacterium]|nr:cadmium-translocating P-type ATPase [Bacillota bacterium]